MTMVLFGSGKQSVVQVRGRGYFPRQPWGRKAHINSDEIFHANRFRRETLIPI